MKYKIAYLKTLNSDFVPYLSDFDILKDDLVMVEGLNDTYKVEKVAEFDTDSMPYDVSKLKKITNLINKDIDEIRIEAKLLPYFSYLDYHTDFLMRKKDNLNKSPMSFIQSLKIINDTNKDYNDLKITFEFSNPLLKINDINLGSIENHREEPIVNPFIHVDLDSLSKLADINIVTLEIAISDNEKVYARFHHIFHLLPINIPSIEARYDFRMYLKYLNKDSYFIEDFINDYELEQNSNPYKKSNVIDSINKIYDAVANLDFNYIDEVLYSSNDELYCNKVRLISEILDTKNANQLDISLFFVSLLLKLNYNPILIMTKVSAFIGVYLKDYKDLEKNVFDNGTLASSNILYNYVTGTNDLILIDVTNKESLKLPFNENINKANQLIYNYDNLFYAYDVRVFSDGLFKSIYTNDLEQDIANLEKNIESPITDVKFIDSAAKQEKDRFTFWEKKLLDLSDANPLVNFNIRITNSIRLAYDGNFGELIKNNNSLKLDSPIKQVQNEDLELTLKSNKKPHDYLEDVNDKIYAFGDEKTLKSIISKSKLATDETGAPTLYLIMGVLKYKRPLKDTGLAPFMVLPIKITKNKNKSGYTINYDYEDAMINQTFFEYYQEQNPDLDYSNLFEIKDERYQDICHTFKVMNNAEIILDSDMFIIANLTFSHYIMWLDMKKRKEELKKNKIVSSIINNRNMLNDFSLDANLSIDELENYNNFAAPLPYDSTQLKAILDCGNGKSFILDGPPGTGKSQTIVNMIVNSFYKGKTVLFVAEKKAALDVVYDRLKKLKLDRFALELHSNKANKSDFFAKLKSSMEIGKTVDPTEFEDSANELEIKKLDLKNQMNKIHNKRYFMSLYDAILESEYNSASPLDLDMNYLINYDEKKDKEIKELLANYKVLAKEIPSFSESLLKYIGITSLNYFDSKNVKNEFIKFQEEYDDLIYSIERLFNRVGISAELNQDIILNLLGAISLSINKNIYRDTINKFFNEINLDDINILFEKSNKLLELKKNNPNLKFNDSLNIESETRINELENAKGFFKKISLKSKCKKELKSISNSKLNKDLISYYKLINEYQNNYNYINNNSNLIDELIGFRLINKIDEIDSIKEQFDNTVELIDYIKELDKLGIEDTLSIFTNLNENKDSDIIDSINEINESSDKFVVNEKNLSDKYKIKYELMNMDIYNRFISFMCNDLDVSLLLIIAKINEISEKLDSFGLKIINDSIINNRININDVEAIYNKSLADGYIRIYFMDDDINYFNPDIFDSEIQKYRKLINDYNNYAIEEVSAKISEKLIHDQIKYMDSSPIGRLKKSIQSQGRGTTIRETLREFDDVIKSYFPVFLMSPLSVAQYLAIDDEFKKGVSKFDIVIFDEASQIPTHEAIGSIARGNSLIVAGDPNQMPPSSYFQTDITISDDDVEFIDADSLLNECLAIDLPRHRLKFHYRSHHESLIKFSNDNFYESSLYTFPSVDSKDFKVHFEYVKPKEEKKNSNISKDETDAIINKIEEIYSNPLNHGKSLGIIVFNITQEETLENRLQSYLLSNPKIREELAYSEEKTGEPYFVKSLENVQGDERDIILISIGFRKNALGRPYINGPLVRANGEKRLNVAVSRSKEEMYIVSTIRFSDFESDERITSLGAKLLKKFLGYAEFNSFEAKVEENNKERLADLIKADLAKYDIDAECGIGSGSVKIDLAIKKKNDNDYSLGVIIDNSIAFSDLSLRDRLYVNEYVLNNLKWKIINVYSVEYFKNKKAVIDKIIKALDDPYVKKDILINPNIREEKKEVIALKPLDYMDAILVKSKYSKEKGFKNLDINLDSIVKTEGPVSFSRIKKIIRDNYEIKSITKSISDFLEEELIKKYLYTIDQNGEKFFFVEQNSYMSNFRLAHGRDIYEVSKEELACAMREITKIQGDLDNDDLFKAVLEAFKFDTKVLNKRIKERLEYVYEYGQKERIIS